MKKALLTTALILSLGMIGIHQAGAQGPGGGPYGGGADCCKGAGDGPAAVQVLDEETTKKFDAFRAETVELRKEMAIKRAEMRALMGAEKPDEERAGKIAGQIFDLRTQLQAKADQIGIEGFGPGFGGGRGGCGGPGGGKGYARGCDGSGDCSRGKGGRWQ